MSLDFRLKNTLARSHNTDPDDVMSAKAAFRDLGYYETPRYGMTPYPDEPLFEGITAFQKDNGLTADGLMKPGGATAKRLGHVLAKKEGGQSHIVAGEHDDLEKLWQPKHFGLDGSVGHGRANGRRDVIAAKRALAWAGHYPGDSARTEDGRPDPDLFEGLRKFQVARGLKPDAWMRPGGETEKALEGELVDRLGPPPGNLGDTLLVETGSGDPAANNDSQSAIQVAAHPAFWSLLWLLLSQGVKQGAKKGGQEILKHAPPVIAGAEATRRSLEKQSDGPSQRRDIADSPPPLPGREPPRDPIPQEEELPANPPQLPSIEVLPVSGDGESQVWIYPMPPEELTGPYVVENRKGNDDTQGEISRIDSLIRRLHPDWELIGGGPGKKEFWFPGPGAAWKDEKGRGGSGVPGGRWADLAYRLPDGSILVVQHADVDRHGKVKQRELDAAFDMRKQRVDGKPVHVLIVPKAWQLEKTKQSK